MSRARELRGLIIKYVLSVEGFMLSDMIAHLGLSYAGRDIGVMNTFLRELVDWKLLSPESRGQQTYYFVTFKRF